MLKEEESDPKKQWENAMLTSINKIEFFYESIWDDGKHSLTPDTQIE